MPFVIGLKTVVHTWAPLAVHYLHLYHTSHGNWHLSVKHYHTIWRSLVRTLFWIVG